nr:MAG TPA: hypothetical protein [Siphoviridae sp. ctuK76]
MTVGKLKDKLAKLDNNDEILFRVSLPIGSYDEMLDVLCKYSDIGKVDNSVTIYLDEMEG